MRRFLVGSVVAAAIVRQPGVAALSSAAAANGQRMQLVRTTDAEGRTGITVTPKSGTYKNVVVFCHGLGDTADGWASMMHFLDHEETKFILPTASTRPIALNGGMQMPGWSDVYGLHANDREDQQGFEASKKRVLELIAEEVEKSKTPYDRIALAGFSQGGALALYTSLTSPLPLAGVVALSTWLPLRDSFPAALTPEGAKLPILQVHGQSDQVVSLQWGKLSADLLAKLVQPAPRFITIPNMGHHADEGELLEVRKFLKEVFASKK